MVKNTFLTTRPIAGGQDKKTDHQFPIRGLVEVIKPGRIKVVPAEEHEELRGCACCV